MKTQIDGKDAPWPENVMSRFEDLTAHLTLASGEPSVITQANYWTPKPYVDEWNRGSDGTHGFVYTVNGRHVCMVNLYGPSLLEDHR